MCCRIKGSSNCDVVDDAAKGHLSRDAEVAGRRTPYVALLRADKLAGFVDREAFLTKAGKTLIDLSW